MGIQKKIKKVKLITIFWVFLIFLAIYIISVGAIFCFYPTIENKIVKKTTQYIPYPAAMADAHFITFAQLANELSAVKKFYQNQNFSKLGLRVDFSTSDGKKRVKVKEKEILEKLIDNAVIESEAKKRGINLTPALINEEVDRKLKEYGAGDHLRNNLEKLYGWKIDDFKKNIVESDMYKTQLFAKIRSTDPAYVTAKKKIEEAQSKLTNGENFADVAKDYSDGQSAKNGGELGWFNASQMLPEVASVIFNLDKNQKSQIIESFIGYHIVKVEDKKMEKNVPMVKVRQIFVRTPSFTDWLSQIEKKERIFVFIREFKWNNQTAQLEFRSAEMKNFEKNLFKNSPNDPSMMF